MPTLQLTNISGSTLSRANEDSTWRSRDSHHVGKNAGICLFFDKPSLPSGAKVESVLCTFNYRNNDTETGTWANMFTGPAVKSGATSPKPESIHSNSNYKEYSERFAAYAGSSYTSMTCNFTLTGEEAETLVAELEAGKSVFLEGYSNANYDHTQVLRSLVFDITYKTTTLYVYNSGWHEAKEVYVYNNGWHKASELHVYNGGWKPQ